MSGPISWSQAGSGTCGSQLFSHGVSSNLVHSSPANGRYFKLEAIRHLEQNAQPKPCKLCARFVTAAIARGFRVIGDEQHSMGINAGTSIKRITDLALRVCDQTLADSHLIQFAKNYGFLLEHLGFRKALTVKMDMSGKIPDEAKKAGNIAVFQPPPSCAEKPGHIQMYTGKKWISDFRQASDLPTTRPTSPWRTEALDYIVYSPPN